MRSCSFKLKIPKPYTNLTRKSNLAKTIMGCTHTRLSTRQYVAFSRLHTNNLKPTRNLNDMDEELSRPLSILDWYTCHFTGAIVITYSLLKKMNYLDVRVVFFEITANTCNGSTSANASNKYIHLTFCIFPDLRASGFKVNLWVQCN